MKIKIIFCFFLISLAFSSFSQINLVPNPSFEDTIMCPNSGGQVSLAKYWFTLINTPDYFNSCNPFNQFSVPSNTFGYQYPNTGEAYMGLWEYFSWIPNSHEIIGTNLILPLVIGQKYFVNFKVCLAWNELYGNNTASNKLGILFSTNNYLSSSSTINFCQIYSNEIINDSVAWTSIKGSFIADSSYSYMSIGNFFDDSQIDTIHLNNSNVYQAYYYIDDICLSEDSLFTEQWTEIGNILSERKINLYPNPAYYQLILENLFSNFQKIDIYDIQGRLLKSISIKGDNKIVVDVSAFIEGIYSIKIINEKSVVIKYFIKSNK